LANASIKKIKERRYFTMDVENKYASKGWATLNTVLGSIGTAGATGILNNLGGIFGTNNNHAPDSMVLGAVLANAMSKNCTCNEDHSVNRYELGLIQENIAKDSRISHLESTIYTDQKIADVYERLNTKIAVIEGQNAQQAVYNATLNGAVSCIQGQIAQLMALTKTVVSAENICPVPMPQYNSWTAPTATTGA
jgi:hypothetical protein